MNRNDEFFDLVNALDNTPPELEDTVRRAQTRAGKRKVSLRVLMVAACLAAALAVGAVAAERAGLQISGILTGTDLPWIEMSGGDIEDYTGYTISGIENFNWDNISEELRAAADAASEASETQDYYYKAFFDSKAELEEFLGFSLPKNPLLTAERESEGHFGVDTGTDDERVVHTFASLDVIGKEETGPIALDIHANYAVPDPNHTRHEIWFDEEGEAHDEGEKPRFASYTVCTNDVNISISIYAASDLGINYYQYKAVNLTQETYVTPGGVEMVIVQEGLGTDSRYQKYMAYFALDEGMMMELSASGGDCKDVKGIFYAILDAYDISR